MISRSYSSEESAPRPGVGQPAGFFDFRQVVSNVPPKRVGEPEARGTASWGGHAGNRAWQAQGHTVPVQRSPVWLKKSHLLFFAFVLVLMNLSKLMAKNDDQRGSWTPPIEPPGSVIVTTSNERPSNHSPVSNTAEAASRPSNPATMAAAPRPQPLQGLVSGSEAELRQALQRWSQAWAEQAVPPYLSLYSSDFEPPKGLSRTNWVKQRTQRISSKKSIQIGIENLTLQIHANQATVRFTQLYQDERLRSSDRKTMHWAWHNGQWEITREFTD